MIVLFLLHGYLAKRKDMEWQPIETAPKDGTSVIIFVDGLQIVAFWGCTGWELNAPLFELFYPEIYGEPTHWMPLPAPPAGV